MCSLLYYIIQYISYILLYSICLVYVFFVILYNAYSASYNLLYITEVMSYIIKW